MPILDPEPQWPFPDPLVVRLSKDDSDGWTWQNIVSAVAFILLMGIILFSLSWLTLLGG